MNMQQKRAVDKLLGPEPPRTTGLAALPPGVREKAHAKNMRYRALRAKLRATPR